MSKIASQGWRYPRCGPIANVLKMEKFEVKPAAGSAIIKMKTAPVHRTDAAVINGTALGKKKIQMPRFPRVGGSEGVGVVVDAGGSAHIKAGDLVWVGPVTGTWGTNIVAASELCHKINPKHEKNAVFGSNLLLAQHLLEDFGGTMPKDAIVMQNGGSSLTSLAVSALAKTKGYKVFTATTPGARYEAAAQRHKAYGSTMFEYTCKGSLALRKELAKVAGKEAAANLFLNGVGGKVFNDFLKCTANKSHTVTYGAQNGFGLMYAPSQVIYRELTLEGANIARFLKGLSYQERQTKLDFVLDAVAAAKLSYPTVDIKSLEKFPEVWDSTFVEGGKKGVISFPK